MTGLKLAKYVEVLRINLLQQFAYRGEVLLRSVTMVLFMVVFAALWTTAYGISGRGQIAGFTLPEVVWYLAMTEALALARARSVRLEIDQAVKGGDIAYALTKPYHYPLFQLMTAVSRQVPQASVNAILGGVVVALLTGQVVGSAAGLASFVALGLLALVLDASVAVLIGLLAFYMEETAPVDWIYTKLWFTVGGMFIPLDLFPDWLRSLSVALPFQYLAYAPARAFVHFDAAHVARSALGVVVWIVVMQAAIALAYRGGSRRVVINGG